MRGGYSITYNPGSYANIARRLAAQPPFAVTETVIGGPSTPPLTLRRRAARSSATTNNWGVDKDYALGLIQTWNATLSKDLTQTWTVLVGYTGIKGTDLDLLSAPNRGPGGTLLIPGVQPFTWESSAAHSLMNQGNVQLTRRLSHGVGGTASYTLAKSMDDTPRRSARAARSSRRTTQPGAEWALSNFDRRQQFTGNLAVELPFGPNRRWLENGGLFRELSSAGGRRRPRSRPVGHAVHGARVRRRQRHRAGHELLAARQLHRARPVRSWPTRRSMRSSTPRPSPRRPPARSATPRAT